MRPRIASYYPDIAIVSRNDGGPLYHTHCLRQLFGQDNVLHLFPYGDLSRKGLFDLHYWVDHGEDACGFPEWKCPKPNVYVTSDTHLGYDYRLKKAREFDWVFCNQKRAVEDFIRDGIPGDRCFWLPHAFDPLAYNRGIFNEKTNQWMTEAVPEKRWDVCFVGNLNDAERADHLDRLFKAIPNFHWDLRQFHEASAIYNASKVCFNVSVRDDINMRCFEVMGSGAFLLTNWIPTLDELFVDGVHLVTYKGMDDMVEKARYYIAHDEEREKIARQGYEWAQLAGTYMRRVLEVLSRTGFFKGEGVPEIPVETWRLKNGEVPNPGLPDLQPEAVSSGA